MECLPCGAEHAIGEEWDGVGYKIYTMLHSAKYFFFFNFKLMASRLDMNKNAVTCANRHTKY